MKVLELFSGTRSIGKAFESRGHEVYSIDYCEDFEADSHDDIGEVTAEQVLRDFGKPDVIWASPDCRTYSMAGIRHHRRKNEDTGELDPVSDDAKRCDEVNRHVMELIQELKPKFWFIENPRGGLRKMAFMRGAPRYTVTYCQYGFKYMKPTDIFTNHPDPQFKPPCKNGAPCHERAPRGSSKGVQGLDTLAKRYAIPPELCNHIVDICEEGDS